jgi:predicted aldo/keto reductase-like oxidoreductase
VKKLGGIAAFERARRDDRIRHIGFSFHDSLSAFKEIIDDYPDWELCQIQYNYVDRDYQAGEAGLAYAAEREIGAVIMEPLRGGALASPPPAVRAALGRYPKPRLPAEWALRFALERQEVVTVLSGMGSADQIWANAAVADSAFANSLTRPELAVLDEARKIYKSKEKVPCTSCAYCQPCPSGVAIPDIFGIYNAAVMFDAKADRSAWYNMGYLKEGKGADRCTRCGVCVTKCPQAISIPDRLVEAHAYLASK